MSRTKWMRLVVRDPADVLRWASQESVRQLDEFRYRIIGGREYISFRMVPRYPIEIGVREIIVVACARGRAPQRVARAMGSAFSSLSTGLMAAFAWLAAPRATAIASVPVRTAQVYRLPARRIG